LANFLRHSNHGRKKCQIPWKKQGFQNKVTKVGKENLAHKEFGNQTTLESPPWKNWEKLHPSKWKMEGNTTYKSQKEILKRVLEEYHP